MKARSTLVLFALALAFGGYLLFVEAKRELPEEAAPGERPRAHLLEFKAEEATSVTLAAGSDAPLSLAFKDGSWSVSQGGKVYPADGNVVADYLETLRSLEGAAVIEEGSVELAPFGLAPAKGRIEIGGRGAQDWKFAVLLGDESPLGGKQYAATEGGKGVYLLESYVVRELAKKAADFRPKTLLPFDKAAVGAIEVAHHQAPPVRLTRKDGVWSLAAAGAEPAPFDPAKADKFVEDLSLLRIAAFLGEPATPGAKHGLAKPTQRYRILDAQGAEIASCEFGDRVTEGPDAGVYARARGVDEVVRVSTWTVDHLPKSAEDFAPDPPPAPDSGDSGDAAGSP